MSRKRNGCTAPVKGHQPGSDGELSCPVHRPRALARGTKERLGGVLLVPPSQRDDAYGCLNHGDTHPESGLVINKNDLPLPGHHNIGQEVRCDVMSAYADGTPGIWEGTVFDGCNIHGPFADFASSRVKIRNSRIQYGLAVKPGSEVSDTSIGGDFAISTDASSQYQRGEVVRAEDWTLVKDCRVSGRVSANRAQLVRVRADISDHTEAFVGDGSVIEGGSWGKLWLDNSEIKGDGTSPAEAASIIAGWNSREMGDDDPLVVLSDVNVKEFIAVHGPVRGSITAKAVTFMIEDEELPDDNLLEVVPPKDSLLQVQPSLSTGGEKTSGSLPKSLSVDPNLFYLRGDVNASGEVGDKRRFANYMNLRGRLAHGDPPLSGRNNAAFEALREMGGISRGRVNRDLLEIALELHPNP